MQDSYYSATVHQFLDTSQDAILGELARAHYHALEHQQRSAWLGQIDILKEQLAADPSGHIFLEFFIPRMGKRADVVLVRGAIIYVIEFKVGSDVFDRHAIDQVQDYALDLKNFHLGGSYD